MKLFEKPWFELVELYAQDIVTESFGTDNVDPDVSDGDMPVEDQN